jgi:hypothetical protein
MSAFTIWDVLYEDDNPNQGTETTADAGAQEAPAADETETGDTEKEGDDGSATDDNSGTDDDSNDDFDIDTSTGDDNGSDDDFQDDSGDDDSSGDSEMEDGNEETNDINTNIFDSLTAEEQQIKISELKNLYNDLYQRCCDVLDKLSQIDVDEYNSKVINRITTVLYNLKENILYYYTTIFSTKSYIENDIAFNKYLVMLNSCSDTLNKYQKKYEAEDNK